MNGFGTYYFQTGDKYQGEWFNNQMNGKGLFTYKDGTVKQGKWSMGNFINR